MFLRFNNLFYPPTDASSGTISGGKELGKEDMIEFLKDDDDDKEVIPLDKDKKKDDKTKEEVNKETVKADKEDKEDDEIEDENEEDEEDELAEIEEELEEPPDEKLELMTPVRRRDILKKYPNVFKDFPYLENAYYREQQFTELFPTPADAKEARDAQETLNKFEKELLSGNIENVLRATKIESPKSFNKLVDNYLNVLGKIDQDAHQHVIGNIIKHTVSALFNHGKQHKNEDSTKAAEILYQFVFPNDTDFRPPSNLSRQEPEKDEEDNKLQKERQAFTKQQFESANNDLNSRVQNSIKKTIEANIDPKTTMSDYIRKNASRDAMDTLVELIDKDTRFKTLIDRLWEKSIESNFSRSSLDNIKSAYFSRAKTLLPSVIKKARNEALKGMGKRVKEEDDSTQEEEEKSPKREKEQSRSNRSNKSDNVIPKGMTTLEFLNKDS